MDSQGYSNNKSVLSKQESRDSRPKPLYAPDHDDGFSTKRTILRTRQKRQRKWLGLNPDLPLKPHEAGSEHFFWNRIRTTFQEPFSEFLGTFVLACFYMGSIAQATTGAGLQTAPGGNGYATFNSVPWGTGIGVMMGIYIAGDSGAYLNPAITLANCMFRGLPWQQLPITIFSQFLGAFVGAAVVYGNYVAGIDNYSGHGVRSVPPVSGYTASIFATYPQSFVPKSSQAIQIITPMTLVALSVSALKDDYNNGVSKAGGNFFPLGMFFLFYGVGVAFGFETSGVTNPALDFSGRLLSYAVGYSGEVWSAGGYYFWMPLILPFIGAALGGFLYDMFVYTGPSPINAPWLGFKKFVDSEEQEYNKKTREKERDDPDSQAV